LILADQQQPEGKAAVMNLNSKSRRKSQAGNLNKNKSPAKRPNAKVFDSFRRKSIPETAVDPREIDRACDLACEFERARRARQRLEKSGGDFAAIEAA
jgi:hypothetical protein